MLENLPPGEIIPPSEEFISPPEEFVPLPEEAPQSLFDRLGSFLAGLISVFGF